MCGVDHTSIVRMTNDWTATPPRPREQKIRELVRSQGVDDTVAFIAVNKKGTIHHFIPPAVCMAVLEYYAFEAKAGNEQAAKSYRLLARKGFADFIYSQVGYNPTGDSGIAWKQFHDRVSLTYHTVPDGYFSVFKELADIFVTLIRGGANLGPAFIPDISVGQLWAAHWKNDNLDVVYGERIRYDHNYPQYFPQSASNPQQPYCYPDDALGEFRKWIRDEYIAKRMPVYLNQKAREGRIPQPAVAAALDAFSASKRITAKR
jgi:hypothetical protein